MGQVVAAYRRFVPVPRLWPGETVVCIGSGPSLTDDDVEFCRGRARVLVVNDAYRKAPWADALYAADEPWWKVHKGVPVFQGLKFSVEPHGRQPTSHTAWPDIHVLRMTGELGLERDQAGLRKGGHSGYQAINLAVHLGAARLVLLGYDCQATNRKAHWFGAHPSGLNTTQTASFIQWRGAYASMVHPLLALGIAVVNCSRETALTCFPRLALRDALPESLERAS